MIRDWKDKVTLVIGFSVLTLIALVVIGCVNSESSRPEGLDERLVTPQEVACGRVIMEDFYDWDAGERSPSYSCEDYEKLDDDMVDFYEGWAHGYNYVVAACFNLPEPEHRAGMPYYNERGGGMGSKYSLEFSIGIGDAADKYPQCGDAVGKAYCDSAPKLNYCVRYRNLIGLEGDGSSFSSVDSDRDGLPDSVDDCPLLDNVLWSGVVSCVDSDNDGTVDALDDCPNNPDYSYGACTYEERNTIPEPPPLPDIPGCDPAPVGYSDDGWPIPPPCLDEWGSGGGPMALCNDGTYSYSQSSSGTCSWHGGVAEWLQ